MGLGCASPKPQLLWDIAPVGAGPGTADTSPEPLVPGVQDSGQGRGAAAPQSPCYLFSAPGRRILPSCHPENGI